MSEIGTKLTPSTLMVLVSVGVGVALGKIIDVALHNQPAKQLSKTLDTADIISAIIGLLMVMFGGKIHRLVKYLGLGIFAFEVAEEIGELGILSPIEQAM